MYVVRRRGSDTWSDAGEHGSINSDTSPFAIANSHPGAISDPVTVAGSVPNSHSGTNVDADT